MNYYAGVDLHKKFSVFTIKDEGGVLVKQEKIANNKEELLRFIKQFDPIKLAVEATFNWAWFSDMCDEENIPLVLSHPLKTRAIAAAKVKTDKIDSETLVDLLRVNLLPISYRFSREERMLKDILRYRIALVRYQTSLKNRVHAILHKHNSQIPVTDIFGKKGRKIFMSLSLPQIYQTMLSRYLSLIETIVLEIGTAEHIAIEEFKKHHFQDDLRRLMTIPGVGRFTAMMILAEVGNIQRFKSAKALSSYVGIIPSVYQSGETRRTGSITKEGTAYLRWALIQAAHKSVVQKSHLASFYRRLKKKDKKKAKVAVARKILVAAYYILSKKTEFKNPGKPAILSG